jgi:hypothetical protein
MNREKSGFLRPNPLTIKHNPKTQNIIGSIPHKEVKMGFRAIVE